MNKKNNTSVSKTDKITKNKTSDTDTDKSDTQHYNNTSSLEHISSSNIRPTQDPYVLENKTHSLASDTEISDFKNMTQEWFKLDDQIKKLNIAIKERKKHKNILDKSVKEFMTKFDYEDLNTSFGRLRVKSKETTIPVKIKEIKNSILEYKNLSGEELIDKIFYQDRKKTTKQNIRRVIDTSPLNLQL